MDAIRGKIHFALEDIGGKVKLGYESGMTAYVTKPLDIGQLQHILEKAMV